MTDHPFISNAGVDFNSQWLQDITIDDGQLALTEDSLFQKVSALSSDQTKDWLLLAVSCMDLTTLAGDDTYERVKALCKTAKHPLANHKVTTAAVCVYHQMIGVAFTELAGSGVQVATVSAGFPAGLSPLETRIREIELSAQAGAHEIDVVITRHLALSGNWQQLYDELVSFKKACGTAHMKTIIAVGDLEDSQTIAKASMVAMMAGSDFIKTSTGMESENATIRATLIMTQMINDYYRLTRYKVGYKPAGGLKTSDQALNHIAAVSDILGQDWLIPSLFRFGASSLLADIENSLNH